MSSQPNRTAPTYEFKEVRDQEMKLIAARRAAASRSPLGPTSASPRNDSQALSAELTGLALSGGGVRSAAFNLGLLQALYDKDLLRQVDYLSTVSGGGYVGAHLSSLAMHPESRFFWHEQSVSPVASSSSQTPAANCDASPKSLALFGKSVSVAEDPVARTLGKGREGIRAKAVGLIARRCRYLTQPSHFLNRQLIGALCLNVVTISGLVMFAALAAWGFRTLDSQPAIRFLDALKIRSDITRALLPALLLFGLWLFSWAVAFFRDRDNAKGEVAKFLLMSWIAAFFLGIAALAGSGDVAISPYFESKYGTNSTETVTWIFKQIGTAGLIAILGGLLPYLHPRALLRSATVNRRGVQGLIYRAATKAMLFGVPLLLFWYFASEDIGGSNTSQMDQIYPDDVERAKTKEAKAKELAQFADPDQETESDRFRETWNLGQKDLEYNTTDDLHLVSIANSAEFWPLVEMSANSKDGLLLERNLRKIPKGIAQALQDARKKAISKLKDPQFQQRRFEELIRSESFWSVGFSCVRYLIGDNETLFEDQLDRKKDIARGNTAIAQQINADVLANASLYRLLGIPKPESFGGLVDSLMEKEKDTKKLGELRQVRELVQTAISYEGELSNIKDKIESTLKNKDVIQAASLEVEQVWERIRDTLWPSQAIASIRVEQVLASLSQKRPKSLTSDELDALREEIRRLVTLGAQIRKNNRQILEFYCLGYLKPPTTVYATIVQPADQVVRWNWATIAGVIWLLSSGLVSLNAISLQGVYRDALSQAWIVDPTPKRGSSMNLHELHEVAAHGCPYHLITGAMSFGAQFGFTPTRDPFLFSPLFCGSETTGYVPSSRYASGGLTLPDAMAISGAAVAPLQIDDPLGRILLTLANFRMGTWLPNPLKPCWHIDQATLPIVPQIFLRLWTSYPQTAGRVHLQWILWQWFLPTERTPFLYLSDGGHYENLGIGELLRRRCRLIIASDAGEDSGYQFEDFIKAVHAGNSRIQIEEVNQHRTLFSRLIPDAETRLSERHFVVMKVKYLDDTASDSPGREGYLIYIKPTLTGDEDSGLRGFRSLNVEFPHDPTANQLFEDDKFEAYRRLGYHIGEQLAEELHGPKDVPFWLGRWSPPLGSNGKPSGPAKLAMPIAATDLGDEITELLKIALDPNQETLRRVFATRFLAGDNSPQAAATLRDLINDPHSEVALCAVKALPLSPTSVPLLAHALSSKHEPVRAEALRLINQHSALELKKNADELVRAVREALSGKAKAKPRPAEIEMRDDGVKILEKLFREADKEDRQHILEIVKEVHANPQPQQQVSTAPFEAKN